MNQIRKVISFIFDVPRLVLYSVYRLGFVIMHPIFSLIYKTRLGKFIFNEIKLMQIYDLSFCAFIAQLSFVLTFVLYALITCTNQVTVEQFLIYVIAYPQIGLLTLLFFIKEWMKNKKLYLTDFEDKPKASFSLTGVEKLRPTKIQDPAFRAWERSGRRTGYSEMGRYGVDRNGCSRDYPVQFGSDRIIRGIPEARIRNFNEFPSEGLSARRVTTPDGVYTEYYEDGEFIKRVKDYEV